VPTRGVGIGDLEIGILRPAEHGAALVDLVASVPVWNLFRPLRIDRLNETVEAVLAGI